MLADAATLLLPATQDETLRLAAAIATIPDLTEVEIDPLFVGQDGITIVDVPMHVEGPR